MTRNHRIEAAIQLILDELVPGEDPALDLKGTPKRVAKMYSKELLSSYQRGAVRKLLRSLKTFPTNGAHEMVLEEPVPFTSLCAHHLLPFVGVAYVGYIPDSRLYGLSKIPRIVDFHAAKLQMQERLTTEVADFIEGHIKPKAVIVLTKARHFCMECRGVRKTGIWTKTTALRGLALTDASVKAEFYQLLKV